MNHVRCKYENEHREHDVGVRQQACHPKSHQRYGKVKQHVVLCRPPCWSEILPDNNVRESSQDEERASCNQQMDCDGLGDHQQVRSNVSPDVERQHKCYDRDPQEIFFRRRSNRCSDGGFDPAAHGIDEAARESQRMKPYAVVVLVVAVSWRELLLQNPVQERRSEEHTSELQSLTNIVCRLLLEIK